MSTPRPERAVILERIEQVLTQRLAESTLPPLVAARGSRAGSEEPEASTRAACGYEEQIEGALTRAEQRSREAESLIEEVTATLAAWHGRAVQLRQRLAEWPTRAL